MLGLRHQTGSASESNSGSVAVLALLRLPGRVNAEQAAALLGFAPWDIPLLVKARLLKPLGRGAAKNCVKYFAGIVVEKCAQNPKWLDAATSAISRCRTVSTPRASLSPKRTRKQVAHQTLTETAPVNPKGSARTIGEPSRTLTGTLAGGEESQ